jgi:hypothetical protein
MKKFIPVVFISLLFFQAIAQPTVEFAVTSSTVTEGINNFKVAVTITNPNANPTSVDINVLGGATAVSGTDYYYTPLSVTFPANSSATQNITVYVVNDKNMEGDESFTFQLAFPTNGASLGSNAQHTVTITGNDTVNAGNCADLFFSEYMKGTGNNRALEIYNPTSSPIDLTEYRISKSNDGGTSGWYFDLNGTIAPNGVYVYGHTAASATVQAIADTLDNFFDFSGNDAMILIHNYDTIDIIGQLGIDPGISWEIDNGSTIDHTLIRNYYTYAGSTDWSNAATTWSVHPNNMTDSLGFHHTAPCGTPPVIIKAAIRFMSAGLTVQENAGSVPVVIEVNNPGTASVKFTVARNDATSTATIVDDYTFQNFQFIKGTGVFYDTLYLNVKDEQRIESTEIATLNLIANSANDSFVVDSIYTLTILDNDTLSVSFNGAGFSYVEDTNMVQVKVTISSPVVDTTTVVVALDAFNSATKNVDYTFVTDTLVFLPNTNDTLSVWVSIIDDAIIEPNEQINFNLVDATNGARLGISAYTLTIIDDDAPSGIEEADAAGIKMYPNPVLSSLIISTESDLLNVEVIDVVGNVVLPVGKLYAGNNTIDVSSLAAGMYFIAVRNADNMFSKRFVKQN